MVMHEFSDMAVTASTSRDGRPAWTWRLDQWTHITVSIWDDELLWVHSTHLGATIPIRQRCDDFRAHGPLPASRQDLARGAIAALCEALGCRPTDWTAR